MSQKHKYEIGSIHGVRKIIALERRNGEIFAETECVLCGKRAFVRARTLFTKKATSCLCTMVKKDFDIADNKRLYGVFHNMKYRCNTPTSDAYHNYGGRGISVCEEWNGENGFLAFKTWAYENGYDDTLTIDRINPDLGYCPENCRWIPKSLNTSLANKSMRTQHRKSDMGTYYVIDKAGRYAEFDNASAFAREHGLDGNSLRYHAHSGTPYGDLKFGFVSSLFPQEPQSTIEKADNTTEVEYIDSETLSVEAPGTV